MVVRMPLQNVNAIHLIPDSEKLDLRKTVVDDLCHGNIAIVGEDVEGLCLDAG